MKNLLITLMVLLIAITAGTAVAGGDWKFYGKLHASIDYLTDGDEAGLYMANNTSRFGFKGGQALNDDFTFVWQFESAVNIPQKGGFTGLANRNSYLGVKGDFGELRFGRHDTPFKIVGRKVDLFKDEMGDLRQATMQWDRRLDDVVAWVSPNWDGFGILAAFQLDQSSDNEDGEADNPVMPSAVSKTAYSVMAHYKADAFFLAAAVEGLSEGYTEIDLDDDIDDDDVPDLFYADTPLGVRFAAAYDAEKFKFVLLYQMLNNFTGMWDVTDPANPEFKGYDSNTIGGGILFRAAPAWNLKGQAYVVNPNKDANDDAGTDGIDESDNKGTMVAIGIDHMAAKNVTFYAQWATFMNGEGADFHLAGSNGHGRSVSGAMDPDGTYNNPMGFSVGSIVKF